MSKGLQDSSLTSKCSLSVKITCRSPWVSKEFLKQLLAALDVILDIAKTSVHFEKNLNEI